MVKEVSLTGKTTVYLIQHTYKQALSAILWDGQMIYLLFVTPHFFFIDLPSQLTR